MSTTSTKQEENKCSYPEYRLDGLQALIVSHYNQKQVIQDSIQMLRMREASSQKEFEEKKHRLATLEDHLNREQQLINVYEKKARLVAQNLEENS